MTELRSIYEIMEGREPGSITIRRIDWDCGWFKPYFRLNSENEWCGIDELDVILVRDAKAKKWRVCEPPKSKVKKWLWRWRGFDGDWYISTTFKTEGEAKASWPASGDREKWGEPIEVEVSE